MPELQGYAPSPICQRCHGTGEVARTIERWVPVCCGRLTYHGECCGDPIPDIQYDVQPDYCDCWSPLSQQQEEGKDA